MKRHEALAASTGKRRRHRRFLILPGVLLVGWFGFNVPGCMESMFMYHPSRAAFVTPPGYEDVEFETSDGLTLHAWFMPAKGSSAENPAPVALHVHGNAGNISGHEAFSDFLPAAGVSVLLFDYRSYGRSERAKGRLHREDLLVDSNAALDYLLTRADVDHDRISVLGVSLGGVIGLALAAQRDEVDRVITVSAFSSWKQIAADHMGVLGRAVATRGLDASESAAALGKRPLLVIHGEQDRIVPVKHAHTIANAARSSGVGTTVVIAPTSEHNDILYGGSTEAGAILEFIRATSAEGLNSGDR